jgi:hypothetical protein
MAGRVIAFTLASLISMLCLVSRATCASSPRAEPTAALNRQLASIAHISDPKDAVLSKAAGFPAARTSTAQTRVFSPQTLATFRMFAARYAAARRILDFRAAGFDANLWGVFAPSRTVKMSYSVKF